MDLCALGKRKWEKVAAAFLVPHRRRWSLLPARGDSLELLL